MNDEFDDADDKYRASNLAHRDVIERTQILTRLRGSDRPRYSSPTQNRDDSNNTGAPSILPQYKKRLHSVPSTRSSTYVEPFARDYARIVHSASFRRLQGKTQLIPAGENEFFRTRLTHSIEVAEIATRIARKLNAEYDYFRKNPIDYELVACAALLHDIGHPPFGHSGEDELNEIMQKHGGFEGNAQTLRMVTNIENRLEGTCEIKRATEKPIGLNLTAGTLASILKYDELLVKPITEDGKAILKKGYYKTEEPIVDWLHQTLGIEKGTRLLSIECQIMDLADDIAYSAYDFEDTLEAGIITPLDFMSIDDKLLKDIQKDVEKRVDKRYRGAVVTHEMIIKQLSGVFGTLLEYGGVDTKYDLNDNWGDRLAFVGRTYTESIMHGKHPLVRRKFLEELIEQNIDAVSVEFNWNLPFMSTLKVESERLVLIESMKSFNFHKIIASRRLRLQHERNRTIIKGIFDALVNKDGFSLLSDFQRERVEACETEDEKKRFFADIIANFTDGEALNFYDQLHSTRNARFWSYIR